MPRKRFETPLTFETLLEETLEVDPEFVLHTPDAAAPSFAATLINEHYPPQGELQLV